MFFQEGPHCIDRDEFKRMVAEFYMAIGWDSQGRPLAAAAGAIEPMLPDVE